MNITYSLFFMLLWNSQCVFCGTLNDTKTLLDHLLTGYDKNVRPVENQSDTLYVSALLYVKSIQEFDEVKGMFSYVGALLVMWNDVSMRWDPAQYGGVWQVTVSYRDVWIPELILSSPSDDVESLGKNWNRIRFYADGNAMWMPADLIKSTCLVNVKNYPFDTQSCVTSFNCLGYDGNEVKFVPMSSKINTDIYQENSRWDIVDTNTAVQDSGAGSQIDLTFHLKRKPWFVIINILMPILFLSLLNVLVFVLVPESGERASYCITVLLSIAVFMTIVSDMLPKSSEPVPNISYKLMVDVITSSLIVLVTIINLRIYSKDNTEPVPNWLKKLYIVLSCSGKTENTDGNQVFPLAEKPPLVDDKRRLSTVKVVHVKEVNSGEQRAPIAMKKASTEVNITWKKISFMLDWIALVFFTLVSVVSFGVYIAVNALRD